MKQTKPTQKVLIKIEQYSDDTTRETIESLEFTGVNLEILKTIHPDPKEALKIALKKNFGHFPDARTGWPVLRVRLNQTRSR